MIAGGCGATSPTAAPPTTPASAPTTAAPPASEQGGPPPLEPAPISLWLSASRVTDKEPTELVAVLVNHNGPNATFGVAAQIDRWDGESWVPHRVVETCLNYWFCTGGLHPYGEAIVIRAIGLS